MERKLLQAYDKSSNKKNKIPVITNITRKRSVNIVQSPPKTRLKKATSEYITKFLAYKYLVTFLDIHWGKTDQREKINGHIQLLIFWNYLLNVIKFETFLCLPLNLNIDDSSNKKNIIIITSMVFFY